MSKNINRRKLSNLKRVKGSFQRSLNDHELEETAGGATTITDITHEVTHKFKEGDFILRLKSGSSVGGNASFVEKQSVYYDGTDVDTSVKTR